MALYLSVGVEEQNPDGALETALVDTVMKPLAHHQAERGEFVSWPQWEPGLAKREQQALADARERFAEELNFWRFVQYCFDTQWAKLKAYANERGVQLVDHLLADRVALRGLVEGHQRDAVVALDAATGAKLGFVTQEIIEEATGARKAIVFIPFSPTPTNGRLVLLDEQAMRPVNMSVNEAFKTSIALGKTDEMVQSVE